MIDARKLLLPPGGGATPIHVVAKADWPKFKATLSDAAQGWAKTHAYEAAPLSLLVVPGKKGSPEAVIVGAPAERDDPFAVGAIAARLPEGRYGFADKTQATLSVALGWAGELYKYDPFRSTKVKAAELVLPTRRWPMRP